MAQLSGIAREPHCPDAVRRRIVSWFALRPRGRSLRTLVGAFDSESGRRPRRGAVRGAPRAPRTLRYVGQGARVDLQVRPHLGQERILHVAVDPACPGATVEVRTPGRKAPRRAILDGDGTVEVALPPGAQSVVVTVRLVNAEAVRTPPLPLS